MIAVLILATVCLVLSIFLLCGKGSWLIAGYNTASKEEKARYDVKKLCRAVGSFLLLVSILTYVLAYLGWRVGRGAIEPAVMSRFSGVYSGLLAFGGIAVAIYANTKCKK